MRAKRWLLSSLKCDGLGGSQSSWLSSSSAASSQTGLQGWQQGLSGQCYAALGCSGTMMPSSSHSYSTKPTSRMEKLKPQPEFPKARLEQYTGIARTFAEAGTEQSMAKGAQRGRGINTGGLSYFAWKRDNLNAIPILPRALGFAGALPFLFTCPTPFKAWELDAYIDTAAQIQMHYAACIISFLGAVHWGGAMASSLSGPAAWQVTRSKYLWSIAPPLAATLALQMPPDTGSIVMCILLIACWLSDRGFAQGSTLPSWYMTLRGYLTCLAVFSLFSTTYYYANEAVQADKLKRGETRPEESTW